MISFFNQNKKSPSAVAKESQKRIEQLEKRVQELSKNLEETRQGMKKALVKVGVVRFNPFHETGGDQSFAIALLDEYNTGFVMMSHYMKDHNRVYAKPVVKGVSEYMLSEEEKEAMKRAMSNG
jgi:anion-transporting  ArsA/GET3 family ATPase